MAQEYKDTTDIPTSILPEPQSDRVVMEVPEQEGYQYCFLQDKGKIPKGYQEFLWWHREV